MGRTASIDIKRPRTDDRWVWDVVFGVYGFPTIVLAHNLKLFPLLANRPRSLPQVCEALGIKRRPAEAILTAAVALGFLKLRDGQCCLTPLAEDYLLDQSPTYFGTYVDLIINNYSVKGTRDARRLTWRKDGGYQFCESYVRCDSVSVPPSR